MTPNQPELLPCPFCAEPDFDLVGLKSHLAKGDCEKWEALEVIRNPFDALTARQSQAVGVGFRMLEEKEIIREGDEFLQDDAVTWVKAGDESGTRWMVGCKHSTVFFKPIRRRITPNDSGKEGGGE